ncbi:MAG: ABC transporter substrate-binding protein [Bacillota bacterium]
MRGKLFLSVVLVLVLVGTLASVKADAATIKMMVRPDEGNVIETFTEKFEEETGIEVQVDYVGWDQISTKTTSALMNQGGGYDILFIPSANKKRFAAMDQFVALDQWYSADEKEEFLSTVLDYYTYNGDMIGVPWYSGGAHFVYNADYLEQAGVDPEQIDTWQDLLAVSGDITADSDAEFAFTPSAKYPGNYYYNYGTMVYAMGGRFVDEDNQPVFNQGVGLEALEILVEGVENEVFNPSGVSLDDYETLKVFQSGKSAFMINSTWSANQAQNPEASNVAESAKIMPIPGGNDQETGGLMYAGAFGVVKASENKDEAVEYLKYLTGEEAQTMHAIEGNNLPTLLSLFEGEQRQAINEEWPVYGQLIDQVEAGVFGLDVLWLDPFRQDLASAVQDALSGKKSPQTALDWAAERAQEYIEEYQ